MNYQKFKFMENLKRKTYITHKDGRKGEIVAITDRDVLVMWETAENQEPVPFQDVRVIHLPTIYHFPAGPLEGPAAAAAPADDTPGPAAAADGLFRKYLIAMRQQDKYKHCRWIPGQGLCGLYPFMFTTGLCLRIHKLGYSGRYCYPGWEDGIHDLRKWDGKSDPPGNWIRFVGNGKEYINNQYNS